MYTFSFLSTFFVFHVHDPPLCMYRVPLPFCSSLDFTSPLPVAPQSCFISQLWPPFSPHFVLRFSLRSVERPFPVYPLSFYRVASLFLSLSFSRPAIFFLSEKKLVPFSCFLFSSLFSRLFLYARLLPSSFSLPSPFFFPP